MTLTNKKRRPNRRRKAELKMLSGERLQYMKIPKKRGTTVTAAELQGLKTRAVEMLIAKILPTKAFALLSAHPKAGKSTLAMTICHSVAMGRPIFGKYPTRQANVLYWIPDDGNTARLGRAWQAIAGTDAPEGMFFNTERHELPTGFGFLKAEIAEYKIGLVVVDTYTSIRSAAGFDFVRDQYNDMRRFGEIAEETGASIVVIHHSAKGSIGDINESSVIKAPS
jgi:RecA-family ATPase